MEFQLDPKDLKYYRALKWKFEAWKCTPALIDKKGGVSRPFIGQRYDPTGIDLVETGWTHDHCEICFVRISESADWGETEGYAADGQWIAKTATQRYSLIDAKAFFFASCDLPQASRSQSTYKRFTG